MWPQVETAARTPSQRKADVLVSLGGGPDGWLATADHTGRPHLVPLALGWDGERIIVRLKSTSRTARNAVASGRVRLALGTTRDVVVVDATVEATPVGDAPGIAALYAASTGWDRGADADAGCSFLLLSPTRIQSWRDQGEFCDRTLMRRGRWVV